MKEKRYTVRKKNDNLKSNPQHITEGSDVGSEPFPFSEDDYSFQEQFHFRGVSRNEP